MKTWLSLPTRLLKKPYDRVFPLILLAVVLGLTCASVRMLVVMPRQDEVSRLQAEDAAGTQRLAQLRQADRAAQEVKDVLNSLPGSRDFAKLPLAISEVAKRDRVDTISHHPLSVIQHLTFAPLNKCPACRLQYFDWRPPQDHG